MEYNIPSPGGDLFADGDSMASSSGTSICKLQIDQGDTSEWTNLKLNNGAYILFTRVGTAGTMRFNNISVENAANCAVDFGTNGSGHQPQSAEFIGGGLGLSNYAFCEGSTVSGVGDATWTVSPLTHLYTTNYGVFSAPVQVFDNSGWGIGYSPFNLANTQPLYMNPNSGVTNFSIQSPGPGSSYDYAQLAIDGTSGSGASATAGIVLRSKATGSVQKWGIYSGTGSGTFLGFYDITDSVYVAKFIANTGIEQFFPPMLATQTAIASASTIAPTAPVFHVTGTTTIQTITAPAACTTSGFACQITIIPDGIFATNTSGNIALASTSVVSKALIMTYDPGTSKWYPSY